MGPQEKITTRTHEGKIFVPALNSYSEPKVVILNFPFLRDIISSTMAANALMLIIDPIKGKIYIAYFLGM